MDARVTARFYRVSPKPATTTDFPALLMQGIRHAQKGDREKEIGDNLVIRLERCRAHGDFLIGEFCRKQTTNIPPQAGPDGLTPIPLGQGQGIGHVAAFRYHRPTRVLLLQRNILSASPRRISAYIGRLEDGALYTIEPVFREDAWDRLRDKRVRSFSVGFASVQNLEALDAEGIAVARGVRLMAQAYQGVEVEVKISVGRSRKEHLGGIMDTIRRLAGHGADVKEMKVQTYRPDGAEDIDFVEEHLGQTDELTLPEGDPEGNYQARKNFLKRVFSARLAYLTRHFGPRN